MTHTLPPGTRAPAPDSPGDPNYRPACIHCGQMVWFWHLRECVESPKITANFGRRGDVQMCFPVDAVPATQ